jgi:hypothetical protein
MRVDFGPLQQIDPAGGFYRGQEAARAEQERNMMRQFQMEQGLAQRENILAQRAEREAMTRGRMRQEQTANELARYIESGMPEGEQGLLRFGEAGVRAAKELREMRGSELDREKKLLDFITPRLAAATAQTYPLIRADIARISPQFAQNLPQQFDAAQISAIARQGMAIKDQLEAGKPQVVRPGERLVSPAGKEIFAAPEVAPRATPSADMQGYELAKSEGFKGTFFDYKRQLAEATRPPAQPREPREPPAPIPVVDPATGQIKYVPREQAVGMTPPQFIEGLTPKERQQREAKFPQATSAVKTFENTSSTLIKDLETLARHPGLSSITGIAAGRIPGITSAGREAEALFDKIVARGGFQELQNMRQASPTGGALGNVSNQEGAQLRQAFAAIDRRQDAASVRKAINDAIQQIRASQQNVREAYDLTYEYKQRGGETSAPAPSPAQRAPAAGAGRYQSLSNEELLRQLGVKPGGR